MNCDRSYRWEEDEEDKKYKTELFVVKAPLSCGFTCIGSIDDELVRPDHMQEWNRVTSGSFQSFFRDTGGYLFFRSNENKRFVIDIVIDICTIDISEQKEAADEINKHMNSDEEKDSI